MNEDLYEVRRRLQEELDRYNFDMYLSNKFGEDAELSNSKLFNRTSTIVLVLVFVSIAHLILITLMANF